MKREYFKESLVKCSLLFWLLRLCCLFMTMAAYAQQQEETELSLLEKLENLEQKTETLENEAKRLQKFRFLGYIQTQFQQGEKDAALRVGAANENPEKSFNRIGFRRGRLKLGYAEGIASGVFELDMTEKGVSIQDAYLNLKELWWGTSSLRTGIFDIPFGDEIPYSSAEIESPERSVLCQAIFPDQRDLGAMLQLQAAESSPWNFLKLEAGLFAGNGINRETDSRLDFSTHLSANKNPGNEMKISGGLSYYNGSVYQGTANVYSMNGKTFILNSNADNEGQFAKRKYYGADAQFSLASACGLSRLRAEYVFGEQPGAKSNSKSPSTSTLPTTDTYIRDFTGGYVMFIQDIRQSPFSAVLKYEWYNPNTKVSGNNNTTDGDIARQAFGFGLLWRAANNLRLQAYYEINGNETTNQIDRYNTDLKDNVFTLRLQYRF